MQDDLGIQDQRCILVFLLKKNVKIMHFEILVMQALINGFLQLVAAPKK